MAETNPIPSSGNDRQNITFISLLRAIASLLVVWCHLVLGWTDHHHVTFFPLKIVQTYLNQPLAIIPGFGFLGVAMFFFVSGFIITHVAQRESQTAFFIKRVLRIYPPLIVSIIAVACVYLLGGDPVDAAGQSQMGQRSFGDFLWATTLFNYFQQTDRYINAVAWTLIIEIVFYFLCFVTLPLMKWSAMTITLLLSALCWVVVLRCRDLGDTFGAVAVSMGLIPLLLIGQSTYWIWIGRIRFWQFALLLAANWFVFACALGSLYSEMLPANNSWGVSALYAYFIFLIAMLANDRLRVPKILSFYATISYSLYLLHVPVGEFLLTKLSPGIGYNWAIIPVFGLVTLASWLSWRFVEQPSQIAAKKLLKFVKANPVAGPFKLVYGLAVPGILVAACVGISLIHPQQRIPMTDFLLPGNLFPAFTVTETSTNTPTASDSQQPSSLSAPVNSTGVDGNFDQADQTTLAGWAWDRTQPNVPVIVEVFIDDTLAGTTVADKPRDDLATAGIGNGHHGFLIQSPEILKDGKPHWISIKVLGSKGEITSSPKFFVNSK